MESITNYVGTILCVKKTYLYTLIISLSKTFFDFLQFFEIRSFNGIKLI